MSTQVQVQKPKPAPRPEPATDAPTVSKRIARIWFT
jgi:hypothetical protein